MADTIALVEIKDADIGVYVDIYAKTLIAPGTALVVIITNSEVKSAVKATQPDANTLDFTPLYQKPDAFTVDIGASGFWINSPVETRISVQEA